MKAPYEWKSALADIIQCYVQEKKQTGFKFEKQERYLQHFDSFYSKELPAWENDTDLMMFLNSLYKN